MNPKIKKGIQTDSPKHNNKNIQYRLKIIFFIDKINDKRLFSHSEALVARFHPIITHTYVDGANMRTVRALRIVRTLFNGFHFLVHSLRPMRRVRIVRALRMVRTLFVFSFISIRYSRCSMYSQYSRVRTCHLHWL